MLSQYHKIPTSNDPEKPFENIVGKGENAAKQHFLLFPLFRTIPKRICFQVTFILAYANAFNMDQSKNLSFGTELGKSLPPQKCRLVQTGKELKATIKCGHDSQICL